MFHNVKDKEIRKAASEAALERGKVIAGFEVIDHGIDGEQYFPGCGVSFSRYTDCYTGIGNSAQEAGEDALEQAASDGWEIPQALESEAKALDTTSDAHDDCEQPGDFTEDEDWHDGCEMHHYVSIRVRP